MHEALVDQGFRFGFLQMSRTFRSTLPVVG